MTTMVTRTCLKCHVYMYIDYTVNILRSLPESCHSWSCWHVLSSSFSVVMPLTFTQKVEGWNLNLDVNCPDWSLSWFSQSLSKRH